MAKAEFKENWTLEIDLTKEENKEFKKKIERFMLEGKLKLLKLENEELRRMNEKLKGRKEKNNTKKVLGKTFNEIVKLWNEAVGQLELEQGKYRCFSMQQTANKVLELIKEEQDRNATSKIISMMLGE